MLARQLDPTNDFTYELVGGLWKEVAGLTPDEYVLVVLRVVWRAWGTACDSGRRRAQVCPHRRRRSERRVLGRRFRWCCDPHGEVCQSFATHGVRVGQGHDPMARCLRRWRAPSQGHRYPAVEAGQLPRYSGRGLSYVAVAIHVVVPGLWRRQLDQRRHVVVRTVQVVAGVLRVCACVCGTSCVWVAHRSSWSSVGWQDVWSYTMAPSSGAPLTPAEEALIIGGETALWGEMVDHTVLLQRAFPRAAAGGERMWSNPDATVTWQDALPRLRVHRARLVARGIPAEPLQPTYCSEGVENTNCPWPA